MFIAGPMSYQKSDQGGKDIHCTWYSPAYMNQTWDQKWLTISSP